MIYDIEVRNPRKTPIPHWASVPFLKEQQVISFHPGLNVIFGPNGSGKSTLLSGLAALMHCKEENWPRVTKQSTKLFLRATGHLADGLWVHHDGMPCRYLGIEQDPGFAPERGMNEVAVDLGSKTMGKALDRQSAGQATITKLVRFLRAEPKKVRYVIKEKSIDSRWRPAFRVATAALKAAEPRLGYPKQQVILLDEPDRSLDFTRQWAVWKQIRALANDGLHQVIVASHSPFAVNSPGAHYIETLPGYLETSRKVFTMLMKEASAAEGAKDAA